MATELPRKQVAIVGVGWSGGIIASELAKAGYECIGLERGSDRKINDFIMQKDELRYAIRYELMQDLSKETLTFRNDQDMLALPMRQMDHSYSVQTLVALGSTGMVNVRDSTLMTLKSVLRRSTSTEKTEFQTICLCKTGAYHTTIWKSILRSSMKQLVLLEKTTK
ncbi:gluconate 2-dehydrogenase, membrane-bound, flavoprotein [Geomicrobium sp. JCM 19038]|nr:gluconate 2-dehydrogenase, membrane-bound, flavoprotein [Geomicrobium sp. JCM 19038]